MKKHLIVVLFMFSLMSCSMNPSKEERIRNLETKIELMSDTLKKLEKKLQTIQEVNKQLVAKVDSLEHK